jgi:hypothetical protein
MLARAFGVELLICCTLDDNTTPVPDAAAGDLVDSQRTCSAASLFAAAAHATATKGLASSLDIVACETL